jgi:trehalose 6-phosphate synthase
MRPALRILVVLLVVLALLAWGASAVMNVTTRTWFERDVDLRARLAVSGAREALVAHLRAGDGRRASAILEDLTRDERLLGAQVCDAAGAAAARSRFYPDAFTCADALARAPRPGRDGVDFVADAEGGRVHVSVVPLSDPAGPAGSAVVVHDMSYIARREAAARGFALGAFGVVAVAASLATIVVARSSWRSWTAELTRLLGSMRDRASNARPRSSQFKPVLRDVRALVAELAAERGDPAGGRWSAERLAQALRQHLRGEGIVVVANREPYLHQRTPGGGIEVQHPASGLVTALEPVMRACSGTWVAHGSGSADREVVDRGDRVRVPPGEESYAIRRVWLGAEEERGYYYGFSNEGLWPLCHVVHARPTFRREDWVQYERANRRFAAAACEEVEGADPIVLVQDYHFALVPQLVRARLPRANVIAFWHIPWPNSERFGICPWNRELLEGMLGSSIVGFHTQLDCNNFLDCVDRFLEARIDRERQAVVMGGRSTLVRPYPISIEWPSRWASRAPPAPECRRAVLEQLGLAPDALLGVGVDRLDYTKGIEERLLAVERLLERFPRLRGRFTFVQLAAPSRTALERYRELNDAVEALAARVNARFASGAYRPIVLLRAHHEPPEIFRFYRAADAVYVSSLQDGMNLVAKEFVAARDDERGVLVLSRFTGAARELTEALLVNPYDLDEASAALAAALAMSPTEQAERMRAMRELVSEFNVYRWAGRMLVDAARVRRRDRLTTRLSVAAPAADESNG